MRSKSLLRLPALLLVLLLVLAAGCGSDSGSDDNASSDDDDTEQVDDSNGDNGDDDGDDGNGSGSGGDGDVGQFCVSFRGVLEEYLNDDDLFSSDERWADYRNALGSLNPPAAIAADWALIMDNFDNDEAAEGESEAYENVDIWTVENCGFDPNEIGVAAE